MKRLLVLSLSIFLLLPLVADSTTQSAKIGESVSISLKGKIEAQELTISVRRGGEEEAIAEDGILVFDFPNREAWVMEIPLVFSYSSNQNIPSNAGLIFEFDELRGENGSTLPAELTTANLSSKTWVFTQDSNRIHLKTTFEAGQQTDVQIGIVNVVFQKTENDLFAYGNYSGAFSIEYEQDS